MMMSMSQNVNRKHRIEAQLAISAPLRKQLWQSVIRAKLQNQSALLRLTGKSCRDIDILAAKVRSGDAGNYEAVAARRYWPRLMGSKFKRDQDEPGVNGLLNYGYAILRAAVCRAIVGAGLLPELGIHHCNQMNPFSLGDDLMEPFRPMIDQMVMTMECGPDAVLTTELKRKLVGVMDSQLEFKDQKVHLRDSIGTVINLYTESLLQKRPLLVYPLLTSDD